MASDKLRWLPMESNPEVMSKFLHDLGLSANWGIVDVIGFDPELLSFLPQPVVSIILLYPYDREKDRETKGLENVPGDVWYMKQTIGNACGTIALIHAVANTQKELQFNSGSLLEQFLEKTKSMTPQERAVALETNEAICETHEKRALEGQTAAPELECTVRDHYVAYVHVNGRIYELDGHKLGPVDHGPTTAETFAVDAGKICQEFMASMPDVTNFSAVALVKND